MIYVCVVRVGAGLEAEVGGCIDSEESQGRMDYIPWLLSMY